MHRFFVSQDAIDNNSISIDGEDAIHISRVLRLKCGEAIIICDTEGKEYECTIRAIDRNNVRCSIIEKRDVTSEPPFKVHLYQGIPKAAKMDLIIQKCTELGIAEVVPVDTERVVVKLENEKEFSGKIARWQRIAEEAAKQSNRGRIPLVSNPISLCEAIDRIKKYDLAIMPYEKEVSTSLKHILRGKNNIKNIGFFIGPEGGFSEQEARIAQENGIMPVTLGPRTLRTETAGFVCLSIIMYELGDIGGKPWIE